jgi:uncharacterized protein with HEPN domain
MTPRDKEALERILECAEAIYAYVARAGLTWSVDSMAVDAIAKRIEEIGEGSRRLSAETMGTMPDVDWRSVKGIRDVIAHDHDEVDVEILARIIQDDLPGLRAAVGGALSAS